MLSLRYTLPVTILLYPLILLCIQFYLHTICVGFVVDLELRSDIIHVHIAITFPSPVICALSWDALMTVCQLIHQLCTETSGINFLGGMI